MMNTNTNNTLNPIDTAMKILTSAADIAGQARKDKQEAYEVYQEAMAKGALEEAEKAKKLMDCCEDTIKNSMGYAAATATSIVDTLCNRPIIEPKPFEERMKAFSDAVLGVTDTTVDPEVKRLEQEQNAEFLEMVREVFGDKAIECVEEDLTDCEINPEAKENATSNLYSWGYTKLYPHGGYRGVLKYELAHPSCDPKYYMLLLGIQDQLRHNSYDGDLEVNAYDSDGNSMGWCMKNRDIPVEEMGDFANMIEELVNSYTLYTYSRMLHGHLSSTFKLTDAELEQVWAWLKGYNEIFVKDNDDAGAAIEYLKGIEDTRILDYSYDVIELIVEDWELLTIK